MELEMAKDGIGEADEHFMRPLAAAGVESEDITFGTQSTGQDDCAIGHDTLAGVQSSQHCQNQTVFSILRPSSLL